MDIIAVTLAVIAMILQEIYTRKEVKRALRLSAAEHIARAYLEKEVGITDRILVVQDRLDRFQKAAKLSDEEIQKFISSVIDYYEEFLEKTGFYDEELLRDPSEQRRVAEPGANVGHEPRSGR